MAGKRFTVGAVATLAVVAAHVAPAAVAIDTSPDRG
jgi:hypothetical protein